MTTLRSRAGFSLSRAVQKKYVGPSPGPAPSDLLLVIIVCQFLQCHPYLFSPEKLTTFFGHQCHFYSFHSFSRLLPIISGMLLCCQKFGAPLVGPLFVGTPVWPNMLNMPKSAAA